MIVRLFLVLVVLLALLPGALAVAPFAIAAVAIKVIGIVGSIISFLIVAIKFIVAWLILAFVLLILGIQFLPFLAKLDLVSLIERTFAEAALCNPAGPAADQTDTRGNTAYRNGNRG